jgi:hypothetical protein
MSFLKGLDRKYIPARSSGNVMDSPPARFPVTKNCTAAARNTQCSQYMAGKQTGPSIRSTGPERPVSTNLRIVGKIPLAWAKYNRT